MAWPSSKCSNAPGLPEIPCCDNCSEADNGAATLIDVMRFPTTNCGLFIYYHVSNENRDLVVGKPSQSFKLALSELDTAMIGS